MDEKEKKLREDLEFHLDTLRRNLEAVSMEDLKTKYAKPFKDLKDSIDNAVLSSPLINVTKQASVDLPQAIRRKILKALFV